MYLNQKHKPADDELLSSDEAAAFLGCSSDRVVRTLGRRELPGIKVGRIWRIPRDALSAALLSMAKNHWNLPSHVSVRIVQMPVLVVSSAKKPRAKSKSSHQK